MCIILGIQGGDARDRGLRCALFHPLSFAPLYHVDNPRVRDLEDEEDGEEQIA